MKSLSKYLPISLIEALNTFNKSLIEYRDELEINSFEQKVHMENESLNQITIKYFIKDSNFYFEIKFIPNKDYLYYNYYPEKINTSKTKKVQKQIFDDKTLKELKMSLANWQNNILNLFKIEDPLEFFKDTFIKSYSAEIINFVGENNDNEFSPLSVEKQNKTIELINEQQLFIKDQLGNTDDKTSEKYKDLNNSYIELEYIKENIPRMTVNELKRRWASTFAVLIKWCGKQLASFAKIDAQNDGNISRSIGNLIGAIFNIPRME